MMQIDRGGSCDGVLHLVPPERETEILGQLWRREMTVRPPGNCPNWIEVEADGRILKAVAFTANPDSPNYIGGLTVEEVASHLAIACGHWGSGAEYLLQTITALESHGVHDPHLWELQERVAELIEAGHPHAFAAT
jgi:cation transport protein ChaC